MKEYLLIFFTGWGCDEYKFGYLETDSERFPLALTLNVMEAL